ncbi:dolichyl-phosphate beta [Phytophthora cinnamomi]|uniref:dolichyl-phosphate beta n=1 Tax=Phytophthora cinnamomi TaxID=4785 RepID=UPI00355A494A|nr:dolichyl-phosphate beta [Phytophthora cinnamomi]
MIFTASDGKTFEDRAAWRLYEFELTYTFRNKTSETLTKLPGQIEGQPFDLSDLDGCTVMLLDHINQVQIDNLSNCRVFIGPSSESVFVRNCSNCVFTIACKQLRTRDCSSCSIYLYSLTDPIIETSQDITFAPFNGAYCGIERNFTDARLEPTNNHWSQVYDFNDPDKTGCNWRILKHEEEAAPWVIDIEPQVPGAAASLGACVNPVARDAGFIQYADSSSSASGGMQSFTFSTSQKEATKVVQATMDNTPVAPSIPAPPAPPVAPTASAAPPPVVEAPSILPPPAPVEAPTVEKQATVTAPEHVAPPPAMPPVLPAVEGADLTTKGPEEPAVDTVVEQVTEMMGMM